MRYDERFGNSNDPPGVRTLDPNSSEAMAAKKRAEEFLDRASAAGVLAPDQIPDWYKKRKAKDPGAQTTQKDFSFMQSSPSLINNQGIDLDRGIAKVHHGILSGGLDQNMSIRPDADGELTTIRETMGIITTRTQMKILAEEILKRKRPGTDGDLYVLMQRNGASISFEMQRISKADGSVKWTQTFTPGYNDWNSQLYSVAVGSDGAYFSFVYHDSNGMDSYEYIQKRDKASGIILWEKNQHVDTGSFVFSPFVMADKTGIYIIHSVPTYHGGWYSSIQYLEQLDTRSGASIWSVALTADGGAGALIGPLAIDPKYVYVGDIDSILFYEDGSALRQYDRKTGAFIKSLSFSDFGSSVPGYQFKITDMVFRNKRLYVATREGVASGTAQWHKINTDGLVIETQSPKYTAVFASSTWPVNWLWTWIAVTEKKIYFSYKESSSINLCKQFNLKGELQSTKTLSYPNEPASTLTSCYIGDLWNYSRINESDMTSKRTNTLPGDYYDIRMAADNGTAGQTFEIP